MLDNIIFSYLWGVKKRIDILKELYQRLETWGYKHSHINIINEAISQNGWFSEDDIIYAVQAIRENLLQPQKIAHWIEGYNMSTLRSENILIIMAGNIPLVGFFDLLCSIVAGHNVYVKLSSKDFVLTKYIIDQIIEIEPSIPIYIYNEEVDLPKINRVIATGSDATAKIFRDKFSKLPTLIRGTRHSVAILSGEESNEDLLSLRDDIYRHSGMGCRNVSMIFTPYFEEFKIESYPTHPKYTRNYLQTRALLTLKGVKFYDNGSSVFVKSQNFPSSLSTVSIVEYDNLNDVKVWLETHDDEIQCVVGGKVINHSRAVAFGEAQRPNLLDYPDEIDVLKFLE